MPREHLHIATLECDTPVPDVYAERGTYGDIFEALLRDAAAQPENPSSVDLRFSQYDCVRGLLPSEEELSNLDAVLITGSASSAYDDVPWIRALNKFIRDLYISHPKIKIFGSCFGHQLLCHALFSTPSHPVVSKDPNGWELGVHAITLDPTFLSHFGPVLSNPSSPSQVRLQFVHADHVVLPSMPEGFHSIGRSEHCALQGVWQPGRVLTYQGHAEFDRFVNTETLKVFGKPIWEEKFLETALDQVDRDNDAFWAAGVMLRFFAEDAQGHSGGFHVTSVSEESGLDRLETSRSELDFVKDMTRTEMGMQKTY